jgi:hypothetical protein
MHSSFLSPRGLRIMPYIAVVRCCGLGLTCPAKDPCVMPGSQSVVLLGVGEAFTRLGHLGCP